MSIIYLDVCCLNRPFDDQAQARIHLEAEAVLVILNQCQAGHLTWISSDVVTLEIERSTGLQALTQALGPVGLVRFLQQFELGQGDYTAERHRWLGSDTVEGLIQEIEHRRQMPNDVQ